ncbi:hypothetical protein IEQ34_007921 [Dendrobium chrysotoxum]|uniref:Uncharacterized protein n=1 Tax=Dendrobium chrysotoxum TaxID=161865 RepID=A0AAV7H6R0_DENCH|nr:hypothetical protein IEQ34_007921 [Dendrobium chrysotoxum]
MGGRGRSLKWMEEREERGQPWRRSFAWRLWEAEQAKWMAKPERVERRREKRRRWKRGWRREGRELGVGWRGRDGGKWEVIVVDGGEKNTHKEKNLLGHSNIQSNKTVLCSSYLLQCATNTSSTSFDDPPSSPAALTASLIFLAFSRIHLPSSPSITILTTSSTRSAATTSRRRSHSLTTKPTFNPSATSLALVGWSECIGHAITGTPAAHRLHARVPPAVAHEPARGSMGQHVQLRHPSPHHLPHPSTAFSKPAGNSRLLLSAVKMSARSASRRTQRNRCPLRRSPDASCSTCSSEVVEVVAKDTYTTEQGGCRSSHSKHKLGVIIVLLCRCINICKLFNKMIIIFI